MNTTRLKQARKHCGFTLNEVAEALGVSSSLPGQWERGDKNITTDKLPAVAKLYGVTSSWLLGEKVVEEPSRYKRLIDPTDILADPESPPGLHDLACRDDLAAALDIRPEEWAALRSLRPVQSLTADGYVAVLLAMRSNVKAT